MRAWITVQVNDDEVVLAAGATLASVLTHLVLDHRGIAIALNGEVAPRSEWLQSAVAHGDRIEILTVAQGG